MWTVIIVVLVAINVFLVFRLTRQKVPKPKKSVKNRGLAVSGDNADKKKVRSASNIGLVLLYWLISGTLVVFTLYIFAFTSHGSDDRPYLLLWFIASLSVLAFIAGIYYLVRGFRSKQGK